MALTQPETRRWPTGAIPASVEAEREMLADFAASGDPHLRESICRRFLPLARAMANRYANGREPFEDLVQIASVGLLKAIDRYDPERGVEFAAYAAPTILGELRHHFRDNAADVRLPRSLQESSSRTESVSEELASELGRPARVAEISARASMSEADVREAMDVTRRRYASSLDVPATPGQPDSPSLVESLGRDDAGYEGVELRMASADASLRRQEREALDLRFHHGLSQREIGERIGVSQMQVSRLIRRGLRKLLVAVRGDEPNGSAGLTAPDSPEPR